MNRTYECMVLLDNREVRQGWDALKKDVSGMLTKHGAEIVSSRLWEERKLAYPINHQQRGTYLMVYFAAPTDTITPINRELQMAEPVLRHVVTVCETVPESAHEPEADFDVSKVGLEPEPPTPEKKAESPAPEKTADAAKEKTADAAKEKTADAAKEKTADAATEKDAKDASKAKDDAPADSPKAETADAGTKEDK